MANSRRGAIPSDIGWLVDELDDVQRRLSTLEAPSGEALSSTVLKLQELVANIQEQIDAWAATRWTNAEIAAEIDDRIAAALPSYVADYVASVLAGDVTIGGSITVAGTVNVPGARATGLSSASDRVVAWIAGDGRLGHTS